MRQLLLAPLLALVACSSVPDLPESIPSTFSIAAVDTTTGELGIAVQSKFVAVGAVVPWARAKTGAIATQAFSNTTFGPAGLDLLASGLSAKETLARLLAKDEDRESRQVGIVDAKGGVATFTGGACHAWAGSIEGEGFCVQGNILAGEEVVREMARAFREAKGELALRLLAALDAGQAAGGDRRGKQSAALLIVRDKSGYGGFNDRYRDLRVDDHPDPIPELRRIYGIHKRVFPGPP
jgi:uncharacterized Ntn-hydrolase superfamily protein